MIFLKKLPTQQWVHYSPNSLLKSLLPALITLAFWLSTNTSAIAIEKFKTIQKGQPLPEITMMGTHGKQVNLNTFKGQVTLLNIVPQLNTPVCDEQTHRFSEQNEGLDEFITLVTLSTNTNTDQEKFFKEANIHNMTFLSDFPDYHFGRITGLLLKEIDILQRTVIVLDEDSIIRYVEIVPMSQLPNFRQAYRVVRSLIAQSS